MTEPFDCVEMKRRAQAAPRAEYESRKSEFSTYLDFIARRTSESPRARGWRDRFARVASGT